MTREEAITLLDDLIGMVEDNHNSDYDTALRMGINELKKEPCDDDCIRRSDVGLTDFEIAMCDGDYKEVLKMLLDKIEKASPVTPQPKTAQWINKHKYNTIYECDNCGRRNIKSNYCPNCGRKMVEPQESEGE